MGADDWGPRTGMAGFFMRKSLPQFAFRRVPPVVCKLHQGTHQPFTQNITFLCLYSVILSNTCPSVQEKLGPALEVVRVKSGGRVRVEPGGDAFIRTVCKLTHVGPKQYAKGWYPNPNPNPQPYPNPDPNTNPMPLHAITGDGIAFRDFLTEKFPNVRNGCVGRAEFSKR